APASMSVEKVVAETAAQAQPMPAAVPAVAAEVVPAPVEPQGKSHSGHGKTPPAKARHGEHMMEAAVQPFGVPVSQVAEVEAVASPVADKAVEDYVAARRANSMSYGGVPFRPAWEPAVDGDAAKRAGSMRYGDQRAETSTDAARTTLAARTEGNTILRR
ncbi:MAG: hypothetical protein K2Q10_05440, partial [Rhodospirillales bacterium]|nr:hypothetical protein [Rhodospirillales bacterium]